MPALTTGEELANAKLDYLVIGGGTAGLVVAARLSEDPSVTVGVLEAGEYHKDDPKVNIPGMMGAGLMDPKLDWAFFSEPQKYLGGRPMFHPRGKGLGGSSALNFMVLVRPAKAELDSWEELGNPGWNWENTLSYMKKSETLDPVKLTKEESLEYAAIPDPSSHGTDGPIHSSFPPHITEVHSALLKSFETLGLPRNNDSFTGASVGTFLGTNAVDAKTATRSYSATGYYAPNIARPNLLVLTGSYATKINFEGVGDLQRAVSVDFTKDGKSFNVAVSKEAILSAGSIQTPQLLELSGVGDKDVLAAHGIDAIIDLPGVGENLQDHGFVPVIVEADGKLDTIENYSNPELMAKEQERYKEQKGLLAGYPSSFFSFIPSNVIGSREDIQRWDEQATLEASAPEVFEKTKPEVKKGIKAGYNILRKFINDPQVPNAQVMLFNGHFPIPGVPVDASKRYLTLMNVYSHPFSRGTIHIKSAVPTDPPSINPNYFSNPAELDVLAKTLRLTFKVLKTAPFKDLVVSNVMPNPESSDEELKEAAKVMTSTLFHPVGTCSMLPKESGGVVDSNLLVYGTSNLRVIDASVIPLLLSANTQTVTYAIAEKGAAIIKGLL
ncbi:GMC oxidoreductase [Cristinia sonorae]|uniref:GMC oxidoreductase n=1 Tax=Cristinia sonorae TaxID=1940300 RepID=A0A8K0UTP3_9AGAR|nr:GMC oxidoreductase [Cristinia sonorae]